MGRYKKLGKNILFMTIGNFASKILSFLLIPFYTAILTTEEYGVVDIMVTTVGLIMPLLTLQINESILRFSLDRERDAGKVFTTGMAIALIGLVIFFGFSPLMLQVETIHDYYFYFLGYYMVAMFHEMICCFARGLEKIVAFSMSGVIHTTIYLVLNIIFLAIMKLGIQGYLLAMILGYVLSTIYLYVSAKMYRYVSKNKFDIKLLGEMLHYSIPLISNSLSWWVSSSFDKYMVSLFCGVAATGVYSISQRIPSLFATVSTVFMTGWMNSSIEDFGSEESTIFFSNVYRKYSALNIIAVSGIVFLTKPLAKILFSKDFFFGWYYVPFLAFAALFNSLSTFLGSIYTSDKKTKMLFVSSLILAATNIILNLVFIPLIGPFGAALATLISYVLVWVIRITDSKKIMKLEWNVRTDMVSYVLIICQIILRTLDINGFSFVGAGIIFLILIVINVMEIKDMFVGLVSIVRKHNIKS